VKSLSFDSYLSGWMGIDNDLVTPMRSVSFWAVTGIALLVPLSRRHYQTFSGLVIHTAFAFVFWLLLYLARWKVAELAELQASDEARRMLRAVSRCLVRLTGVLLIAMAMRLI
jgi:hypothetical protein